MLISLLLGALVGAVLGLTGAGGGILAVPALVAGMGWPMQQAAPVALVAVAGSAALGAIEAFRRGLVRYRAAFLMAAAGVPFTSTGVWLAQLLSQRVLLALFACVMLFVAARLILSVLSGRHAAVNESRLCVGHVDPDTGRLVWTWPVAAALAATGALTGLMTGLLGVGGGFIIVPLLRKLTHLTMHGIVATSLMVIALVGTGGIAATLLRGTPMPLLPTLGFAGTTAAGMLAGRMVSQRLPAHWVQMGFALVLVVVACGLLVKAAMTGPSA